MSGVASVEVGSKPWNAGGSIHSDKDVAVVAGRSSVMFAIFNFAKTMVGAGVFTAPHAMLISGYFGLIFFLLIATVVMYLTCRVIMNLGLRHNVYSYKAVCEKTIGKWGGLVEQVMSFLITFGAMVSYSLIAADSLPPLFLQLTGYDLECLEDPNCDGGSGVAAARILLDRRFMLAITAVIILYPLIILPDVHFLSYSSMFGLFCFLLIAVSLSQRALTLPESERGSLKGSELLSIIHPAKIPNAVSRSAFMNICQHAQFMIFNSLAENTQRNRNIVIISSLSISTILVITFSTLVYLPLNDKLQGNVFNSFSYDDTLVNVCRLALSFHIMASYPLQGHVCRIIPFNLIKGEHSEFTTRQRMIYSTALFVVTTVLAMVLCDLGVIVDMTGGIAAGTLSFVLPGLLWIVTARRDQVKGKVKYIPASVLFICGLVLVGYTLVFSIYEAATGHSSAKCLYKFS